MFSTSGCKNHMANKLHNRPKILQEAAGAYHIAAAAPIPPTQNELFGSSGKYISEDDYFAYYYGFGDINYEWNNGILEAKPMSDPTKARMYAWLFRLLIQYLEIHPIAKYIMLEIGFRIDIQARTLPDVGKRAIRKPLYIGFTNQLCPPTYLIFLTRKFSNRKVSFLYPVLSIPNQCEIVMSYPK